jgi:hypothetical protein
MQINIIEPKSYFNKESLRLLSLAVEAYGSSPFKLYSRIIEIAKDRFFYKFKSQYPAEVLADLAETRVDFTFEFIHDSLNLLPKNIFTYLVLNDICDPDCKIEYKEYYHRDVGAIVQAGDKIILLHHSCNAIAQMISKVEQNTDKGAQSFDILLSECMSILTGYQNSVYLYEAQIKKNNRCQNSGDKV